MAFDKANLTPIQVGVDRNTRVYYIRYDFVPMVRPQIGPTMMQGPGPGRLQRPHVLNTPNPGIVPTDQLFALLKPAEPRLFEVNTALDFRKAVAAIISDIGHLAGN